MAKGQGARRQKDIARMIPNFVPQKGTKFALPWNLKRFHGTNPRQSFGLTGAKGLHDKILVGFCRLAR